MKRVLVGLLALLLCSVSVATELGSYTNAATLLGTERIPADQTSGSYPCTNCTVNLTPAQIATYMQTHSTNLSGDCTLNSSFAITCTKINGVTVPASAAVLASNSSGQLISQTAVGSGSVVFASGVLGSGSAVLASSTTGSGSVVLATSPTLTTPNIGSATATGLTLSSITGSTQCLQVNTSGVVSGTAAACGSGGGGGGNVSTSGSPVSPQIAQFTSSTTITGVTLGTIYYATTSAIGGSALSAGACTTATTVTISGVTTSMVATASPAGTAPGSGFYWIAWVSASNTVTVEVCAAAAGTPTSTNYNVRVIP